MQYLAAYTLASLSGKEPTKDQLTNILKATGQKFDEAEITKVVASLKGKKIEDLIKAGTAKVGAGSASSGAPKAADKPAKK
jgi:large subunit ribosomal protein LP2